jgi:hypothetical protein
MEDHRFIFGFQIPIDLSGSTYFIKYQNFRRRNDWALALLRTQYSDYENVLYTDAQGNPLFIKQQLFKNVTSMFMFDISHPVDRIKSFKFHTAFRQDKLVQRAQDTLSLTYDFPNSTQYWSLSRGEFVYDNTRSPFLNIRFGTRYKVYAEYMYQLTGQKQSCYNIGFDFRNYQKLYKNIIWATRAAYAHSDGTAPVQYQLGGVDNWENSKNAANSTGGGNYGFMALETSLRGYNYMARLGNNFGVLSNEVRVPICNTFLHRPVQSPLLKNLQFVAFMDLGTAWKGFLPSAEATEARYSYPQLGTQPSQPFGNVGLNFTVPNASGLAVGYGAGIRTMLLGYFLRLDTAWNIDGSKKPILYIALGTDF